MGRRKLPRKTLICPTCGKKFQVIITEDRTYCSLSCRRHTEKWKEEQSRRELGRKMPVSFVNMRRTAWSGDGNPSRNSVLREKVAESRRGRSLGELGHKENCSCCVCRAKRGECKAENSYWYGKKLSEPHVRSIIQSVCSKNKAETKLESILDKHFPGEWEFVGDGKLIIAGKNPDFAHKEDKKLIELFGDYWHGESVTGVPEDQHEEERIQLFENEGYQTLVIWEHELEDEDAMVERIKNGGE